jgi:hypothetical protein
MIYEVYFITKYNLEGEGWIIPCKNKKEAVAFAKSLKKDTDIQFVEVRISRV